MYAITKYGYPPSIENGLRALAEMKEMGFRNVELEGVRRENLLAVYERRHELRKFCANEGLSVVNFCPVLPECMSLDERERRASWDLFQYAVEIAQLFACETIQGDSFTPPLEFEGASPYKDEIGYGERYTVKVSPTFRWKDQWEVMVETFSVFTNEAKKAGLKFCVEPRVGELVSNTDALLRMIDTIRDPNFGCVFDIAHLNAQKEILVLSIEKLGDRIFAIHAADNDGRDNIHAAPGHGTVDWEGVFEALRKHRFAGYIAVDVGMVPDVASQYRESLRFLTDLAARCGL
jgi:sugar phosphate isomerase/epimerase